MSNKRITDLTELTNPTTDDVFPVVDIATNTTTKVQLGNLPTTTAVTTALATKQDTLVSGTNIKTVNSTSLLGAGDVAVQETLVSGTNIKTLNSTSLLGSGDIVLTANPSGVSGAIQFSNGSAFASDAANFFWDDTNNRLGIGTNAPSAKVFIQGTEVQTSGTHLTIQGTGTGGFSFADSYATSYYSMYPSGVLAANRTYANYIINSSASGNDTAFNSTSALNLQIGGVNKLGASINGINIIDRLTVNSSSVDTSARAVIKGSGSTSATTSLLVQNSAGTSALTVRDNLQTTFGGTILGTNCVMTANVEFQNILYGSNFFSQNTGATTLGSSSAADASAMLDIRSTTRGFLPPRMTTTQKNAIASPAAGLVVYDSTTNKLCCYNGSTWNDLF